VVIRADRLDEKYAAAYTAFSIKWQLLSPPAMPIRRTLGICVGQGGRITAGGASKVWHA
jgi:hypothetical protein